MAERPDVRCRLPEGGPAGAPTTSKFVLKSTTGGKTIPLLNGDNILEVESPAQGVGEGLDITEEDRKLQAANYEKQVLLRTTNEPRGGVLLKAFRVVGIRGGQSTSSASSRKGSPSPARAGQASPGTGARVSPASAARPSPSTMARWSGGGRTWVTPDAQDFLLVGDTLDLGTGGAGRNFRCRFSFTLYLASQVAGEAAGGGSSSGGGGSGGGTKRGLEGAFADKSGDVQLLPSPRPAAIEIDDSSDDEAAGAGATPPKRRRRDRDRSSAGSRKPTDVVDLCGSDNLPGKSNHQPLDLCVSDEEGAAAGPATASGARAAPVPPSASGGGGCSSGGGGSSSSASPKGRVEPERRVPPPTRIEGDVSQPGVSHQAPRAAPAAVDADLSLVEAPPPATIENDQPEAPPPSPPSSPFRSLRLKPSPSPRAPSPSAGEGERSVTSSSAQGSLVSPCHAAGDSVGGGAAGPLVEPPASAPQTLTRMHDDFRNSLKIFLRNDYNHTIPVVEEFLARGTAPHPTLCGVLMAELLNSRCSRGNECLRRQLRAMLNVDPGCWEPPDDDASAWLEEVMRGMTTGKASKPQKDPPRNSDDDAEAMARAKADAIARAIKEAPAVVEARTIALEVVVDYLAAGRGERSTPLRTPPQDGSPTTSAVARRVMQFFPKKQRAQPRKNSKKSTQEKKNAELARQDAQLAVETSAAWAVGLWGSTVVPGGEVGPGNGAGAGAGAGTPQHRQQRRRRQRPESPVLARARLMATRFMAEVVETCGLPVNEACGVILKQMNSFSAVAGVAGAAKGSTGYRKPAAADADGGAAAPEATRAKDAGCRGLGAAARGGLVRALLARQFCPELARVLLDDLGGAGDGSASTRADVGGVGRLRALLSRLLRQAKESSDPDLLLSVGS